MPHRIDIELTSRGAEGAWTWRAAGARQPRGVLSESLAPEGAKVGDVLRVEVESGMEGIEVVGVLPPRSNARDERAGRIEIIGPERRAPDVSVSLVSGSRRRRDSAAPERERSRERRGSANRPDGRSDQGDRGARRSTGGEPRDHVGARGGGDPRRGNGAGRGVTERPSGPEERSPRRGGAVRDRRPSVSTVHRNAALAELRPEEVPVAEQLLRGGLPAVRQAIEEQNARARQEGRPTVSPEPLLATAERLVPVVNLAAWKDRATAAQGAGRDVRLRELRAVVAASRTVPLDQEGRSMARVLQETLEHRVGALRDEWLGRITKALEHGRIVDALHAATRPPEPGTRCPAEIAVRLAEAAGAAMTADLASEEWLEVLDAVVDSPVRRTVRPAGIPHDESVRSAALRAAGLVPDLARQLGLPVPPPPPRRTGVRERVGVGRSGPPRGGAAPADAS